MAEVGPSNIAERPRQSKKGKGKATEEEWVANEVDKAISLSDEQWGLRQCFLVDWVLKKRLKIEALFWEITTLEGMMEDA
jgi:hypothetical protein